MKISGNITLTSQSDLKRTASAIAKSLERLSAGIRVIAPRDDISSHALSVALQSQARGLKQANLNANLTMSLIETAGSALESQLEILQEMRAIAVEASSSSLTTTERQALQEEVLSLLSDYRRITSDTEFNGRKLLDGSFGSQRLQVGANKEDYASLQLGSLKASDIFTKTVGTGSFAGRTSVSSLAGPRAVVLEDFNQDGNLDMVVTQTGVGAFGNTIQVYDGTGQGTFQKRREILADWGPSEIRAGDVTGDGILDLVTFGSSEGLFIPRLSILAGNGDGTFDAATYINLASGFSANDIELVDLNSDGVLDIVSLETNGSSAGQISRYLSYGNGTFTAAETDSVSFDRVTLGSGDLNGDGSPDILVGGGSSSSASLFLGSASGSLTAGTAISSMGRQISGFVVADFDRDGDLDVATSNNNDTSARFALNAGNGTFASPAVNTVGSAAEDIKAADLNKDGYIDMFVLNENSQSISVLLGNGTGTFQNIATIGLGGSINNGAFDLALGDLDNDGVVDLVAPEYNNFVGTEISIIRSLTQTASAEGDVGVQTTAQAQQLLEIVDSAIEKITKGGASISAIHSRLQFAYASNLLAMESYLDADSRATDVDLALETAELVRQQILQQTQVAVLAQANLSLQTVLALLDF